MKVLVISSYPPRHCGIGAYARDQVARLRAAGHEVTVLSPSDGGGDLRRPFPGGKAFLTAARVGGGYDRIVVHFQPALYYRPRAAMSKVATSLSLLWLTLTRRRTEILVHEADPPVVWRPDYFVLGLAFRAAGSLAFHTDSERREVAGAYGMTPRGRVVEHKVAPVDGLPASKGRARAELDVEDAEPIFVCVGFLQPSKGFDRAIEAFARAGRGSLFVVGSVREETADNCAYAEDLARTCASVPGATLVNGYLTDREFDLWLRAADWLVLPYRKSSSSGVLARAHALGTPAIVTAVGGLPEQAGPSDVVAADDAGLANAFRASSGRSGAAANGAPAAYNRYAPSPGASSPVGDPQ